MTGPILDHVVILVPQSFLDSPPSWLSEAFTLYPGGRHVDGATQNTLVLLPDGSYLEFIAFVPGADPELRKRHRWGHKEEGTVVDWALTLGSDGDASLKVTGEKAFGEIQQRVRDSKAGIVYHDLISGGRKRLDGVELKWAISSPQQDASEQRVEPGQSPFWCLDETPRDLRVPYQEPGVGEHTSGVTGVAGIQVGRLEASLEPVYTAVLGEANSEGWALEAISGGLHPGSRVQLSEQNGGHIEISFYTAKKEWEGKVIGGKVGEHELEFKLVGQK